MEKAYTKTMNDVIDQMGSAKNGLSSDGALRRLDKYGPNKLKEADKPTIFKNFWNN